MISIIIPTYNERENIGNLVLDISRAMKKYDYEIIVVDDSSPDKTIDVLRYLPKDIPLVTVLRKGKRDLSKSIMMGVRISNGNFCCIMDGDSSHPPSKIPELIEGLKEGNDVVIAKRFGNGWRIEGRPILRKLISYFANTAAMPLTHLSDPVSGFFAFRKEIISGIELTPRGYKCLLEILVKGEFERVKEVPYVFVDRKKGRSKLGLKIFIDYFVQLLNLYLYKVFSSK